MSSRLGHDSFVCDELAVATAAYRNGWHRAVTGTHTALHRGDQRIDIGYSTAGRMMRAQRSLLDHPIGEPLLYQDPDTLATLLAWITEPRPDTQRESEIQR